MEQQQIEEQIKARADTGNARTVEYFVTEIKSAIADSVEAFIKIGRLLNEAKDELGHGRWLDMVDDHLPFNVRTAQRFMAIAGNRILSNATHVSFLPPAWGTLYELSRLEDEVLEAKLADGTIHPGMERKEAVELKPKGTPRRDSPSPRTQKTINNELRSELEQTKARIAELEAAPTLETARAQYAELIKGLPPKERKQERQELDALLKQTA